MPSGSGGLELGLCSGVFVVVTVGWRSCRDINSIWSVLIHSAAAGIDHGQCEESPVSSDVAVVFKASFSMTTSLHPANQ